MAIYKIASIPFEMITRYERTARQALPYLASEKDVPLFKIELSLAFIAEKEEEFPELSKDEIEYIFLGQLFYRHILRYNGIMLHSSAVVYHNKAYLFSAPSGTGKSTHTKLWLEEFTGSYILNDDKPLILCDQNKIFACGTPFSGKVDLSKNVKIPLQAICFIERSNTNWVKEIDSRQAIMEILNQTERIPYEKDMDLILKHIETIISNVKIYKMGCNISRDAAQTAYRYLSND